MDDEDEVALIVHALRDYYKLKYPLSIKILEASREIFAARNWFLDDIMRHHYKYRRPIRW